MSSTTPPPPAAPRPPADLNPRREPVLDFPDRELGEMRAHDYQTLGFMCGLEVHQQLLTSSKLFCRCPAGIRTDEVDAEVLRHMRPTLSELGEYDGTALMEFKTRKEIIYQLARTCVCTYEIDDTPPFEIDREAVRIAIEISQLLNLNLVSELHVMRKQYLDGSIPTGFQRTAMVGLTGAIPFRGSELGRDRQLRIRQLSLEEDSCREVSDVGHVIRFRTDRLGMPLIETVTEPELFTPRDAAEGIRLLASVARATGKVRRGAGAARQDVNVSVAGGRRVEIKGVCSHRAVPLLTHNEGFRQLNLLRIKAELERRGVRPSDLELPERGLPWEISELAADVSSILKKTDYAPVREVLDRGQMACAIKLPNFAGLVAHRTQPGITFARELADRVRVIACLTSSPFMIHSDVGEYGLGGAQWRAVRRACKARRADAVVVVWGITADVATAAREVLARAREALDGVPPETRQAGSDGTTGFERILPGPDRMYPDTDTPPVPIAESMVVEICRAPVELPWDREDRYQRAGLLPAAATRLAVAPWADLFDDLAPAPGRPAQRLASALEKRMPGLIAARGRSVLAGADRLRPLVAALATHEPFAHVFEELLVKAVDDPNIDPEALAAEYMKDRPAALDATLQQLVSDVLATRHKVRGRRDGALLRWAMGRIMPALIGRVEPEKVRDRLIAELKVEVPAA